MFLTILTFQVNANCILVAENIGHGQTGNVKLYVEERIARAVPAASVQAVGNGVSVIEVTGKSADAVREQWRTLNETRTMTAR